MKNRKIVQALAKLNKQELLRFQVFLESPYFNVNKDVLALYNHIHFGLSKNHLDKMPEDMDTWQLMFPGKPFDSRRFNLLFFYLSNQFDRFISQLEYEKLNFFKEKLKCEILGNIGIRDWQRERIKLNMQSLEADNDYSSNILLYKYFISKLKEKIITGSTSIKYLKMYYVLEKLDVNITLLGAKKMYQLEEEIKFLDYIKVLLNEEYVNEYPSINIYNKITQALLEESDTNYYFSFRKLMNEKINFFSHKMRKEIYTLAVSYCISQVNQSRTEFNREVFELYRESVEGRYILENNEISVSDYRNIVVLALRVREFEWTENFIENYQKYINPKFRDNAVYFSLARLEINRENYEKVLDYLQLINYEDVWYQLGARTMQMAAYYKLGEFDALESLLNAYKMFITREKSLTKDRKSAYLNLIKYTKKLLYLLPNQKDKISKIRKDIEANKLIVNKSWLLERVDELAKSKS